MSRALQLLALWNTVLSPCCVGSEDACDCGYAAGYPKCCLSLTVEPGASGKAFIGSYGVLIPLGSVVQGKDTAMALNHGGEGACRFVFITDRYDTLFGQELYFEGGFCL